MTIGADVFDQRAHVDRQWPTLDPVALYGLPGEVVATIDPHTEADPAALLADFLVSYGNCVGAGPHILADGTAHPARLNVTLVGETSRARKGTSRAQIRRVFDVIDTEWAQTRVLSGLSSGEGLIAAVADPAVDEKDRETGGSRDRRALVVEPEFARVLAATGRDSSTLSPIIRDAWDTGTLRVLTRRDPLVATGAHVSMIAHVTAEELERKLTETESANGFANRFLFVCVRRSKLLPSGGALSTTEIGRLGRLGRMSLEKARKVGTLRRTADADDLWQQLYTDLADNDPGGLLGAITARAEAQLLRLSLTYALTDGVGYIGTEHLNAAWAFWNYSEASARYLFGDATGDEMADKLLAKLRQVHPQGLDGTEQRDLFGRNLAGKRLEYVRQLLERKGHAVTVQEDTGGRPRTVTYYVSKNGTTKTTNSFNSHKQ